MAIKVLGIDPGLAATGIGLVTGVGNRIAHFAYGAIKTPSENPLAIRLEHIFVRLEVLLKDENPDLIVIEDIFSLEKYPKSGLTLGKVCGVILLAAQKAHLETIEISVREAKQVLTGNGNADKEQLEKAVRKALSSPKPIRPFHASDALGLALIGLFRYGRQHQTPKTKDELKTVH
jgi:crossover junction endodeoxyribonuclease RuvC